MNKKQKRTRNRIVAALAIFAVVFAVTEFVPLAQYVGGKTNALYLGFVLFLIPYLIAGYDVLLKAARVANGFTRIRSPRSVTISIASEGALTV